MKLIFTAFFILIPFSQLISQNDSFILNMIDNSQSIYNFEQVRRVELLNAPIPVEDLIITTDTETIDIGDSLQIEYSIFPDSATNQEVVWKSSDENIAKVSDSGMIYGISEGNVTITGQIIGEEIEANITLNVQPVTSVESWLSHITIYPNPTDEKLFIDVKNKLPFQVILSDLNGNVLYSDYDKKVIDLNSYSSGLYNITLVIDGQYLNYKIIKN